MGQGLVPYLCCPDAAAAIEFYVSVFGATEVQRWTDDSGRIGHAELSLAGEPLFLSDEYPEIGVRGPRAYGGTPVSLVLSVADPDATVARAVAAGATVERPVKDQDDGSRAGWIFDPYGHRWNLQNQGLDLPVDQLRDRIGDKYTITE